MKPILFQILLLISLNGFAQNPDSKCKNISICKECDFFDYLKDLSSRNLKKLELSYNERRSLLLRLEEYLLVFRSETIQPMLLKYPLDSLSCPDFTAQYKVYSNDYTIKKDNIVDEIRNKIAEPHQVDVTNLLFALCGLLQEKEAKNVEKYISEFKDSYTLDFLYQNYKKEHVKTCETAPNIECLAKFTYENNLQKIAERINFLDNKNYCLYESYHSKPDRLKGFEAHHDNDVFVFIPSSLNQDRELTGALKFSFATDFFKMRFIRFRKKPESVLSYQTLSVGGYGYTPYIRYRNDIDLADTLHLFDRPFASYYFVERAKHRIWRKGLIRQKGEFQIGSIGLQQGRNLQAQLHEDVIHEAQFVYGWDKQIGNGGRLVFQVNQKIDLLLFSNTNNHASVFKPTKRFTKSKTKYAGINVILETDLRWGAYITSAGIGLRFSTLDLLKQSGANQILSNKKFAHDFGWKADLGISYRYVQHNTMLEGIGYMKTFPQDNFDTPIEDYHTLPKEQIERNLLLIDLGVSMRWRKTTLYYRLVFHTLEYESKLKDFDFKGYEHLVKLEDPSFYDDTIIKEQQSFLNRTWFGGKTFYGYGTIGVSWFIE